MAAARNAVDGVRVDDRLRGIAALREWLPEVERDAVEHAVAVGGTWARIAAALGVSRQAVHRKHARPVDAATASRRRQRIVEERAAWERQKADQERFALEYLERVARRETEG